MIPCPCPRQIFMLSLITSILWATSSSASTTTTHRDFLALLSLKSHITTTSDALSSWVAASNGTSSSPEFCRWTGVTCGGRRHPGRVTAINLHGYGLEGTISQEIGNLTYLRSIDLSSNSLVGGIPSGLGSCRKLRAMNLSTNHLSGSAPAPLGHLSKLTTLDVSSNDLSGEIPTTLLNVTTLMVLRIGGNSFQGRIPSWLSNLTSLTDLYLVNNNFSGNIPAGLCRLTNLARFDVMNNKLEGPVPPSLFNISSIAIMGLDFNRLTGSLPHDIGFQLPKLFALATYYNHFEGPIPASLSNASELRYLILRGNRHRGLIPRDIGAHGKLKFFSVGYNELRATKPRDWEFLTSLANCSNLERLDLEQNNFLGAMPASSVANLSRELSWFTVGRNHIEGSISPWIGLFQKLALLTLDDNLFAGTLPTDIGQLSGLEVLDLSRNGFEGQIPQSLGNITVLSNLSLSNNFLNDSIPASLGRLAHITSMDLSCNLLTGQIPQEILTIPSLTILLNLSANALSGAIPAEVGHLNSLGALDLSMNKKLDGEIPEAIGGCVQLRFLYLQGNLLRGQLPKGLGNLVALERMDLSGNSLKGPIPEFLETMRSLNYLNLSFNHLSGPVPDTGAFRNAAMLLSVTGNSMLCGGPPFLQLPSCPSIRPHRASPHRLHVFVFGGAGGIMFIFCVCSATAYCFSKGRRTTAPSSAGREYLFFNEEHERISYAQLREATGSFSPANLIGSGSSGKVYIGDLAFGKNLATVAVKVLDLGQQGASRRFLAECDALKRIRHRKLVKVITVCSGLDQNGDEFKALVLEYFRNGSLDEWLHPDKTANSMARRSLCLMKRLGIALDVAEALEYLHGHIDPRIGIVHCDIKPSNILLDDGFVGHVADFGLAKIMSSEAGRRTHPETEGSSFAVKGTIGYVPPEYGSGSDVSMDGDTYSYGVVLLEMFTGRRPTDSFIDGVANLVSFVKMAYPDHLLEILDATATYDRDTDTQAILDILVYPVFSVALACCNDSPRQRMKMHDVVEKLNAIKLACAVQMPCSANT